MFRRTDFDIANAVSAISAAPDPKACSRIFRKAIAAFKIDAFASGEVDLAAPERTVFYAIGWPDTWHKFYVGAGVILRDPVVNALKHRHGPFTWSELWRDGNGRRPAPRCCRSLLNTDGPKGSSCRFRAAINALDLSACYVSVAPLTPTRSQCWRCSRTAFTSGCAIWFRSMDLQLRRSG